MIDKGISPGQLLKGQAGDEVTQLEGLSLSLAPRPKAFGLLTLVLGWNSDRQTLFHATHPNPSFQILQRYPSPNLMLGSTGHWLMCWTIAADLSMFGWAPGSQKGMEVTRGGMRTGCSHRATTCLL